MTNNWSSPLFNGDGELDETMVESEIESDPKPDFWNTKFGHRAGVDERARTIEKSLGY